MSDIRWGIIGCGNVTEIKSGPALQNAKGSCLVAVMRRDGKLAEDYAQRHNVGKWYDDADKLIHAPDIDAIYMHAVQLIHGNGGWPLNCFALPDGRPFYGGTHFRLEQWRSLLENISMIFLQRKIDLEQQAEKIVEGIKGDFHVESGDKLLHFGPDQMEEMLDSLLVKFDKNHGGLTGAPKFPMPGSLMFLLKNFELSRDMGIGQFLKLSLNKMASGGLYDHLAGGFARYSVDQEWKVPHFEKMLYDNAQMISLYAAASRVFDDPELLSVAKETADFIL